jgi:hypothetical protein
MGLVGVMLMNMHALLAALVLSQSGTSVSNTATKIELSPERRLELRLLTDGKGHYLAWDARNPIGGDLFYGDGKVFHQVPAPGGGSSGIVNDEKGLLKDAENFSISLWDPRTGVQRPEFEMKEHLEEFSVSCGSRTTKLVPAKKEEADKLLTAASFMTRRWTRLPHKLYRDDSGTYYFVDRLRTEDVKRDLRLYMGKKGKMKLAPLKDIVDDSVGTIFATKNGQLRLISDVSPQWIVGKKKTNLTEIPVEDNAALIYNDLGPYSGERLGTPCDDL